MVTKQIQASVAMLRVLEAWHVKNVYGYPAGSVNSIMNALDHERHRIRLIQVRHEQVGALAASAHAKLTRSIGVAFGSAGPGAINMLDGLYDAREDHAPVLAIVGQSASDNLNRDSFQELSEQPIFSDVACYDRVVMTPASLPHVTNQAIKTAYAHRGVAIIILPNDFGFAKIPYSRVDSPIVQPVRCQPEINVTQVERVLRLIHSAKRPIFHIGWGIHDNEHGLMKLAKRLKVPVVIDASAKGLFSGDAVADLGTGNRLVSKPADELLSVTDLVVAIGEDFALPNAFNRHHHFKFIQIDNRLDHLGRHHRLTLGIQSTAKAFIKRALRIARPVKISPFYRAAIADVLNWQEFLRHLTLINSNPILPAQVYHQINRIAARDAIFSVDIGDNTINSYRYLSLRPPKRWVSSGHFATMGISLPGAIAAQLDYPDRQVFSIAGDGAFSMVMQDLITERKYRLPIINIITVNETTNFIKGSQAESKMKYFGIDLAKQNFAMIAKGMGVAARNVTRAADLPKAFDWVKRVTAAGQPGLLSVRVTAARGLPVDQLRTKIKSGHLLEKAINFKNLREFFDTNHGRQLRSLAFWFRRFNVKI